MIEFSDKQMRKSGVVYSSTLQQIEMLYKQDPMSAGELAISLLELVLRGEYKTDNFTVNLVLKQMEEITARDADKYAAKEKNAKEYKKIRYQKIAELYLQGKKQNEIAEILGKDKSTISRDMAVIRKDFPELLKAESDQQASYLF